MTNHEDNKKIFAVAILGDFLRNAVIVQLYFLLSGFWERIFVGGWDRKIYIQEKSFTAASYSVASVLISYGAVLGRVGPLEFLIMGLV